MTAHHIPIVMLIIGIGFQPDNQAEIFGFWYFAEIELPQTKKGGGVFMGYLVRDQCCQLLVRGTQDQILQILRLSDFKDVEGLTRAAAQSVGSYIDFEDIHDPQGTSAGVDVMVKMTEHKDAVIEKLKSRRDTIELQIDPSWVWSLFD